MVQHRADGLAQARLHGALLHPRVELATQVVARQPPTPIGNGQGGVGAARTTELLGGEGVCGAARRATQRRVERHFTAVGVRPDHP